MGLVTLLAAACLLVGCGQHIYKPKDVITEHHIFPISPRIASSVSEEDNKLLVKTERQMEDIEFVEGVYAPWYSFLDVSFQRNFNVKLPDHQIKKMITGDIWHVDTTTEKRTFEFSQATAISTKEVPLDKGHDEGRTLNCTYCGTVNHYTVHVSSLGIVHSVGYQLRDGTKDSMLTDLDLKKGSTFLVSRYHYGTCDGVIARPSFEEGDTLSDNLIHRTLY